MNLKSRTISWGVLGASQFALQRFIPAVKMSAMSRIDAIASRSIDKAKKAAAELGIPRAYGSYEELISDPAIEVVHNTLPNSLHVPWTVKAAEAGKHVLCEKPIALNLADARALLAASERSGKLIMEAFMVRSHPQWLRTQALIREGRIGELRAVHGYFTSTQLDPANIRNQAELGGGAIMDLGCYLVTFSRFLFGTEPRRVVSLIDRDPGMRIDRLATWLLDFPNGQAALSCSTQLGRSQRVTVFGARGRIEVEVPVNAPDDRPCRVFVDDGRDFLGSGIETISIGACNQYTIEADQFSLAVRDGASPLLSLEDSILNMRVIDAIVRSAETDEWETP